MQNIIAYYKICNVKPAKDKTAPLINLIDEKIRTIIFSEKQISLYTKSTMSAGKTVFQIAENIIGAEETAKIDFTTPMDKRAIVL